MRLDPIRLAIPQVSKDTCREFWGSCLQFNQIEKPENLKLRGGAWFRKEAVEIHLGTETPISAAKKAHLGNAVEDIDALSGHVEQQSCSVNWDTSLPDRDRFFTTDPVGNRIEYLGDT